MADSEGSDTGAQTSTAGVDPAAIAVALGGASRQKADAFLEDQRAFIADQRKLIQLQAKELSHELELRHWSLLVRHMSGVLKLTFEIALAISAVALVWFLGTEVWNAAHDDGLVIEAFSVPPSLAASGLTGQVVAARIEDQLSALTAGTNSIRAPGSFANNWGDDIKVEIPETRVSIGELANYLHRLLGHQTHITGEVVDRAGTLTITARTGADPAARASGSDADMDTVLDQVSDAIFARTQPYRYGIHLLIQGRIAEAEAHFQNVARSGPLAERPWAYAGLFNVYAGLGQGAAANAAAKASIAQRPDFAWGWSKVAAAENNLDQPEQTLGALATEARLLDNGGAGDLRPEGIPLLKAEIEGRKDELTGDYGGQLAALPGVYQGQVAPDAARSADLVQALISRIGANASTLAGEFRVNGSVLANLHDLARARRLLDAEPTIAAAITQYGDSTKRPDMTDLGPFVAQSFRVIAMQIALMQGDWRGLLDVGGAATAADPALAARGRAATYAPVSVWPLMALAEAETGDFKAAHAGINRTPADCDLCLRVRGRIDALQGNQVGADFWFARAESTERSIPFADEDWGRVLLQRGDAERAAEKFAAASKRGPHFADPLEGWGEALMAKNQSHLALAKFEEADKYAPNWGRLHLKWGEALRYAGKKDEAKKQFAAASKLDLTLADKSELERLRSAHG